MDDPLFPRYALVAFKPSSNTTREEFLLEEDLSSSELIHRIAELRLHDLQSDGPNWEVVRYYGPPVVIHQKYLEEAVAGIIAITLAARQTAQEERKAEEDRLWEEKRPPEVG